MKRLLSLLLTSALLFVLSGCTFRSSEERQMMRTQMDYAQDAPAISSFDYALEDGTALEPYELFSNGEASITVLGIYETADEYILPMRLSNEGKDWYHFYSGQCTVNGWQVLTSLYEDVCPGGMVDAQFRLYKSDLPLNMGPVGEIWLEMSCSSMGNDSYHPIEETITLGEVADIVLDAPALYSESGVTVHLLGLRENDYALALDLAVVNDSDRGLYLGSDGEYPTVNGQETDISLWDSCYLEPGSRAILNLELSWYELEPWEVYAKEDLKTLELKLELDRSGVTTQIPILVELGETEGPEET